MSEKAPRSPEPQAISRRRFLELMLKGGATAAAVTAGTKLGFEVGMDALKNAELPQLETENASYTLLYERHDQTLNPDKIPKDCDVLAVELGWNSFSTTSENVIATLDATATHKNTQSFQMGDGTLLTDYCAQNNIQIALIDHDTYENALRDHDFSSAFMMSGGTAVMVLVLRFLRSEKQKEDTHNSETAEISVGGITRKKFLKHTAGLFAMLGSIGSTRVLATLLRADQSNHEDDTPLERIATRVDGLISNLNPYDHIIFFRNLMMALRVEGLAGLEKNHLNRKAKIAIKIGSNHSGIEDFLRLGKEGCLQILTMYPPEVLRWFMENAGNSHDISSVRVLSNNQGKLDNDTFFTDREILEVFQKKMGETPVTNER